MMQYALHFFGDSFTAGDEVVDHKYVDNYPSYKNFWDWSKLPDNQRYRPFLGHVDKQQLLAEERKQSYAGILGGVNHGVGGYSMQSIQRSVIQHLENTDQKAIIFIQPTGIERWCEYVNDKWIDYMYPGQEPMDDARQYYKFRLSHSTHSSNLLLWHNCMLTLLAYVKSHPNTVDYWIINNGTFNEIQSIMDDERISNKMITKFIEKTREKTINFPHVDDMQHPYFCVGGHVNAEAHQVLAQRIKKVLR